jgi:hypothetical protein
MNPFVIIFKQRYVFKAKTKTQFNLKMLQKSRSGAGCWGVYFNRVQIVVLRYCARIKYCGHPRHPTTILVKPHYIWKNSQKLLNLIHHETEGL